MNTLINYPLPDWIAIAFLCVIFIPSIMIAFLAKKGLDNSNKALFAVLAFFGLYFTYVSVASLNGLVDGVFLPPLVLLFCTLPLALFLFIIVLNLKIFKQFLNNIPLENLVSVHIFRLIGVFFLLLAFYDSLPKFFAIVAGLGDMITAVTSILVAKAITNRKHYAKKLTFLWNCFGLLDILFTAVSANVLTKLSLDTGSMGIDTLARFPFCFIPAFAPPVIIFLHILIFKKIKETFA